ncbi:MAG: TIM-barrel domain-containing protein [bacterium]
MTIPYSDVKKDNNFVNSAAVVIGHRRFICLSPTLVRIEFSPDGIFDDRRSMVAYNQQQPVAFTAITRDGKWDVLDTGAMQIRTIDNDKPCNRNNLELRWNDGKLMQIWRPGDRDYQNLGGTLRSLDRYGGESCVLDGVQTATMESPDPGGTTWPAWLQCEIDPLYVDLHPDAPANFGRGHWLRDAQQQFNDGKYTERTFNWYKVSRKFCPGVLSRSGYYLLNDSEGAVMDEDDFPIERDKPGYQDWYFFAYGKNYLQALQDFRLLSGPVPVLPHKDYGIIFSRWPAFSEDEITEMAHDFAANGYPLSTLVMDMEWHKEGWGHWEYNPELIPDPQRFFAFCRKYNLDVTFNDHPLDVRDDDSHFDEYIKQAGPDVEINTREYNGKTLRMAKVDICNKAQNTAFRKVCHTHIINDGLDYWWNDGSRGQLTTTHGQLVTNKTFFEESERDGRRGMLLGRYGGFGSHRYGGFFTGDTTSDFDVLRLQCEFNIRASGVGVSNISHDMGGFCLAPSQLTTNRSGEKIIKPELYLRWLQFGVFNPIMRFHCAPGSGSRKPYDYDTELNGECRRWLRIRHSLLPYIYTASRTCYDTGMPITRGLYLMEPENNAGYRFDEFYFGPDMLVAPVLSTDKERTIYLPEGEWYEFETAKIVSGGQEITRNVELSEVPVYVKAGSIIPRQSSDDNIHAAHIKHLLLDVYPGAEGCAELYEDDGRSPDYKQGDFCRTRFNMRKNNNIIEIAGKVIEGKPLGGIRQITIDVSLDKLPLSAFLNGDIEINCKKIDTENRYQFHLPEIKSGDPFKVVILLNM